MGVFDFRHVGATNERWYFAGQIVGGTPLSQFLADNIIYAWPLAIESQRTLGKISVNVLTEGDPGSIIYFGVYASTSDTNLYPSTRLLNPGSVAVDVAGVQTLAVSLVLNADSLYWIAAKQDAGGGLGPELQVTISTTWWNLLGTDSGLNTTDGSWAATYVPAGIPDPYPSGTLGGTGSVVAIQLSA